ncbi:hypothetical protein K461DRAFT_293559 [Myriangium duriaei CBS 260.36]|uniref:ATP synthase subunit K, mitochondrial n=1 Tax=Myriangium duriaei CBS 260.36 TaxID=1168546 RepID=A0A9P4J4H1_9PEZI|nr:hypothetical protein K461DRAFT_293559 [Myriangium duriaei CBS 260.36]
MVVKYDLLGRKIGSHQLAMAVLGSIFGGVYIGTRGGSSKQAQQTPPIQASSKDEENFIQEFLKEADAKPAKH